MNLVLIKNGQVDIYPYSLTTFRATHTDVSLPEDPTEAQLNEQDIYTVYLENPPLYNHITQNCAEGIPKLQNGKWTQTWLVTAASQQEVEYREDQIRYNNKAYGTKLLQDTDWAAIPSIADPLESNPYLENRQQFIEYRNQVRSIVLNPPAEVVTFPDKPNEQWS